MNIRDIDLNLLPALDALLRHHSVTRAAVELGITQSALSTALRRLRELLGDELFVRTGRGLMPTPRALALAAPVTAILEQVREQVLQSERFDPASSRRNFRLLLSDIGAYVLLPRIVHALRQRAPHVTVTLKTLKTEAIAVDLADGRADLAIGNFPQLPGSIFQRRLFEREWVGLVHGRHPLADKRLTVREFARLPHLVVHMPSGIQEHIDAALAKAGLAREATLEVSSYLMVPPLLEAGDFITVLPRQLADDYVRRGDFRIVRVPVKLPVSTLRLHWHRRYHDDAGNVWLRNEVVALLA